MLILTEWNGEGLLNLIQVFFPSSSVCKAFFLQRLTSKFPVRKSLGGGVLENGGRRKATRGSLCYHIHYCFTQSQRTAHNRVTAGSLKKKEKPKTKKHSVFQCIAVSAVKNKLKLNISVQCCAMSCDLIQQCLNSEQLRELNEGNTHTHFNFPLKATHLSSSM